MKGDPLKCPHCHSPLRLDYMSATERRFRCSICGKQTTVNLEPAPLAGSKVVEPTEPAVEDSPS
jgi:transposase-like protein